MEKPTSRLLGSLEGVARKKLDNSMLLSPNKKCRTAQSASCPQSLPSHFLVCSERCKAERVPVREVTGSATGCRGEEFPHLLLHVCWTFFRGEGHVWAIGSFTLQVFQRQTLVQSSWWVGKGESNIMKPMWPYLWSLAQVNKLMEAGVGSEWSYVKRSYGSPWKLGGLESLLWCITLEECISRVSTAADLLCSFGVGLTCRADCVTVLYGIYTFSGT